MVATDVASRGIGMIEIPLPCTATPSRLQSSALLSTLRRFLVCVFCPGSFVSFGSLFKGVLDLECSMFCATLASQIHKYFPRYKCGVGIT